MTDSLVEANDLKAKGLMVIEVWKSAGPSKHHASQIEITSGREAQARDV
jgi:hypothetical protein